MNTYRCSHSSTLSRGVCLYPIEGFRMLEEAACRAVSVGLYICRAL